MVPWLVWTLLCMAVETVSLIYCLCIIERNVPLLIEAPIIYFILLCFWSYSFICEFAYYRVLKREEMTEFSPTQKRLKMLALEKEKDSEYRDSMRSFRGSMSRKVYPKSIWDP